MKFNEVKFISYLFLELKISSLKIAQYVKIELKRHTENMTMFKYVYIYIHV